MKGLVRTIAPRKMFGFIRTTNHGDFFFHKSDFDGDWGSIGTRLQYTEG